MPCLFAVFAGFFPRIATILVWLARPVMFDNAFNGRWFLPVLGIIFLPFTTLMYVVLWAALPSGIYGWDWLWLGLAVVCDISSWVSSAYTNRDRVPWYSSPEPGMA
jgi:hypothetical protein